MNDFPGYGEDAQNIDHIIIAEAVFILSQHGYPVEPATQDEHDLKEEIDAAYGLGMSSVENMKFFDQCIAAMRNRTIPGMENPDAALDMLNANLMALDYCGPGMIDAAVGALSMHEYDDLDMRNRLLVDKVGRAARSSEPHMQYMKDRVSEMFGMATDPSIPFESSPAMLKKNLSDLGYDFDEPAQTLN